MKISFKNFECYSDEICSTHWNYKQPNIHEKIVIQIIKGWNTDKEEFEFFTSGSTGKPKKIRVDKKKIIYSVRSTFDYIDPKKKIQNCLLCIDPEFVGGAMVVFRALIKDLDMKVLAPCANPFAKIKVEEFFDIVSLTPYQIKKSCPNDQQLNQFGNILVGGAPFNNFFHRSNTKIYATFGMTETISHIALKENSSKDDTFHCIGDTIIDTDKAGRLKIKGSITDHKWVKTNDVVKKNNSTAFRWLGRFDNVINSGGIKFYPEMLEKKLSNAISSPFLIAPVFDKYFGEKIILLVESEKKLKIDVSMLSAYEKPKKIIYLKRFIYISNNKIDRKKTIELINRV